MLRRLDAAGILDGMVVAGSWCVVFYQAYFDSKNFTPTIRTRDLDFAIPLPPRFGKKVDIAELLDGLGFVVDFRGEAVAGGQEARRGMAHIAEILGHSGEWAMLSRTYRKVLFMHAGTHTQKGRTIREEQIEKVLEAGGKLSKAELLHCKVRYFSDGVVLGSKAFVEDVFQSHREEFGLKRKTGARKPKHGQWGELCTMRDLRLDPVTLSKAA